MLNAPRFRLFVGVTVIAAARPEASTVTALVTVLVTPTSAEASTVSRSAVSENPARVTLWAAPSLSGGRPPAHAWSSTT